MCWYHDCGLWEKQVGQERLEIFAGVFRNTKMWDYGRNHFGEEYKELHFGQIKLEVIITCLIEDIK